MSQALGILSVSWGGTKYPCEDGSTFKQGGLVNETTTAGAQVFYSKKMMASEVSITTPYTAKTSIAAILAEKNRELQFICDTGQSYVSPNAWVVGQPEITGGKGGKLKITWNAPDAEELL
ncbi:MAG: phage tail tube protein [Acidiphilium sp.]